MPRAVSHMGVVIGGLLTRCAVLVVSIMGPLYQPCESCKQNCEAIFGGLRDVLPMGSHSAPLFVRGEEGAETRWQRQLPGRGVLDWSPSHEAA